MADRCLVRLPDARARATRDGPRGRVDRHLVQPAEIDHDAVIAARTAGLTMLAAAYRDGQPAAACEIEGVRGVLGIGTLRHQQRVPVKSEILAAARGLVRRAVAADQLTGETGREVSEVKRRARGRARLRPSDDQLRNRERTGQRGDTFHGISPADQTHGHLPLRFRPNWRCRRRTSMSRPALSSRPRQRCCARPPAYPVAWSC